MAVNKMDLKITQLIDDLNNGLTWLKKDDLGYGSIEAKYGANEKQILAIKKHPKLKDAETSITIFNIIDDTIKESHSDQMIDVMNKEPKEEKQYDMEKVLESFAPIQKVINESFSDDSFSAFANL